jgi:hypothetical protein
MIGRRHRLIVEEQQQMLLNSQVVPKKLLSLRGLGLRFKISHRLPRNREPYC